MIDWLLKCIDGLFLGYTIRFKANGYEKQDNPVVPKGNGKRNFKKKGFNMVRKKKTK